MITEFKIYENSYSKYSVGDYVILREDDVHKKWKVELEVYIYEVYYNESMKNYYYHVEGRYVNNIEKVDFWINDTEIERKMTSEEIEYYKVRDESNKYNL